MTEQEIKQKINDCDRQIVAAYNNLRSVAQDVGARGHLAVISASQNAMAKASANKLRNTLLPLIISVVGFFIISLSGFVGFVMLIGGIALAIHLHGKAEKELRDVRSNYNQMVSITENELRNLQSTLDSTTKI